MNWCTFNQFFGSALSALIYYILLIHCFINKIQKGVFLATIEVQCPLCKLHLVVKFGMSREGRQRYQCRNHDCKKNTFLLDYTNKAYLPGVKEKIIEMAMSGSGIRDTSRVLGISQDTVISELKKKKAKSKI